MLMEETFVISMAHHLPTFPEGHKCRNVHGHTCHIEVAIEVGDDPGCAFDHKDIRVFFWKLIKPLDHGGLVNDVAAELADGLAESQLRWLWARLKNALVEWPCELITIAHVEFSSGEHGDGIAHRKSLP